MLLSVLDRKDIGGPLLLPLDDRSGGCVQRDRPGPVPLGFDRRLPILDVLPLEIQDFGLPHARVDGELDQVSEGLLERARALPGADQPAGREDGLGLVVGERFDCPVLPEELDLLDGIRALVDLPVDGLLEHATQQLHVSLKRGLAARPVDLVVADLDLPGLEPGSQLFKVIGGDV